MNNINVYNDINNKVKQFYYDRIINDLQNGWIDYLNNRTMSEWLIDDEYQSEYYNWDDINSIDNYEWYNNCWKDWLKINYIDSSRYSNNIYQHMIWEELLLEIKLNIKIKLIIYILLISLGYYITN